MRRRVPVISLLVFIAWSISMPAAERKVLTLDDYAGWNRIASTALSADGAWISYAYRPNDGDEVLHLRSLTSEKDHTTLGGATPAFSRNGRFAAYVVNLPKKEADALRKAKKPVSRKVELLELASGQRWTVDHAASFSFSEDSRVIAVRKEKADREAKHEGTDLILRDLETGTTMSVGNVASLAFAKGSSRLAYTVDAADKAGNGVYLLEPPAGALRALDTSASDYAQLTWSEDGSSLAVLRGTKKSGQLQRDNALLAYAGLAAATPSPVVLDPASDKAFPAGMVVSELGSLEWSADRTRIFCGIKAQETEPEKSDQPLANVDVWHWKDERVQSIQMVRAEADRRATFRSAFVLASKRFVRLADEDMPGVTVTEDGRWAIGRLDKPYRMEIGWGGSRADYYRVDTATGERTLLVKGLARAMGASPDSRWFLYLKDGRLQVCDLATATTKDLSSAAGTSFVNDDDDHPYEKPAYGLAGWSRDGKQVLVYHRFDLWGLPLEGGAPRNLTGGSGTKDQVVFRYVRLDSEERSIDTAAPLLLSAYGEWTKQSGFYRLMPDGRLEKLLLVDKSVGRPEKARSADRVAFTMETFTEFPDVYVSDLSFAQPEKVTDANPQIGNYAWGSRVLVDYKNSKGVRLQATLTLPASFQKGTRYPMLVYFYEKMSQRHHEFSMPVYDDRPHMSLYASDGYLVLMPDIVYTTGRPGSSALDCTMAAIKAVLDLGYADPARIGLQGHSWGGYESSFLLTQTDIFAAVVTGAPPTNLFSFYNELYKSSGSVQHGIMEQGQVRMGTTPWADPRLYESQSPMQHAPKIKTPFLILHGTDDGAVDWHQGLELYNAARRLGKEVILLSYPGEAHHLTKVENQKDFLVRMKQFFDHHLKGVPAPPWMTEGVPFLKKARITT